MKTHFLFIKLAFLVFCFLPFLVIGQGGDPTPAATTPVGNAPIDGGIIGLLMAGLSYGFYKFKKKGL